MFIYMDACCWNRPFDFLGHDNIYLEAVAVWKILSRCRYEWETASSDIIDFELTKMPNKNKLLKIQRIYAVAKRHLSLTLEIEARAGKIHGWGADWLDSLHLATAEINQCDVFLSTDIKLLKSAKNMNLSIKTFNPVQWYFGGNL